MNFARIVVVLLLIGFIQTKAVDVEFNLVYPIDLQVESVVVVIKATPTSEEQSFPLVTSKENLNATHQYLYSSPTEVSEELEYRYLILYLNGTTVAENFWRQLKNCRIQSNSDSLVQTKNEFFGQSEIYIGVPPIPNVSGIQIVPPKYFDDNQIITVSLQISQADLNSVIFNPEDKGEVYVKANLTMVSLNSTNVFTQMKIRRAGGTSLSMAPYSYQIKLKDNGPAGEDTVIKFKAYPFDFQRDSAYIIAEKTSADICSAVGAPINYVSYARIFINGIYQGIYGMLEKVDENFAQRRWPFIQSGNSVGTLYKVQGANSYILDQNGFHNGFDNIALTQSADNTTCCPCYENGCAVDNGCNVFGNGDDVCPTLECCSCSWEKNGVFDVETANCAVEQPWYDFITLGNAIFSGNVSHIDAILDAESYSRSLMCSLAVMNNDGYAYNGFNYYWYTDPVSGQFKLILYDQDSTLTNSRYTYSDSWTPYDWTYVGDLTDAAMLKTVLQLNMTLNAYYTNLFTNFLEDYYRPDQTGPLFDRMNIYANFIQKYNPQRVDIISPTISSIKYFITPLSEKLYQQLSVSKSPIVENLPSTCNSTVPL